MRCVLFLMPVNEFSLFYENYKLLEVEYASPVANNFVPESIFSPYQAASGSNGLLDYYAKDVVGNEARGSIMMPYVNTNPAALSLSSYRLKYSKNLPQSIVLYVEKRGSLLGYELLLFGNRKLYFIQFDACEVNVEG